MWLSRFSILKQCYHFKANIPKIDGMGSLIVGWNERAAFETEQYLFSPVSWVVVDIFSRHSWMIPIQDRSSLLVIRVRVWHERGQNTKTSSQGITRFIIKSFSSIQVVLRNVLYTSMHNMVNHLLKRARHGQPFAQPCSLCLVVLIVGTFAQSFCEHVLSERMFEHLPSLTDFIFSWRRTSGRKAFLNRSKQFECFGGVPRSLTLSCVPLEVLQRM